VRNRGRPVELFSTIFPVYEPVPLKFPEETRLRGRENRFCYDGGGVPFADMTSLGERLREERVRRGLTLEQLASQTKIGSAMLAAIEAEEFDRLPGGFFARSFVRQYARALGLAESEIDAEIARLTAPEQPPGHSEPSFRPEVRGMPLAQRRRPGAGSQLLGRLFAFVLIVAACSGLYVLWERSRQPQAAAPAVQAARPAGRPAASAVQAEQQPAETAPQAAQAVQPGVQQQPAPQAAAPQQETAPAPAAAGAAPAGQAEAAPEPAVIPVSADPDAPVKVDLRARGEVWVRAVSRGETQFEGTLQSGDTRTFTSSEPITVKIGRPAAVELTLNGQPAGPLGSAEGPVTVEVTRDSFRVLKPAAGPPDAP